MEDFLKNFADALNQPDAGFTADRKLKDVPNWDSLAILTTLSMVDQEYGVTLTGADLQACETIGDVYARIGKSGESA